MAGPWFVDPENGLTTNNGLTVATPWQLIPGQTGATSQTGYGVTTGDVINIRNGTTANAAGDRIVLPANDLTYRGYGVADNVLILTLPKGNGTFSKRVVREAGVHEGMWRIDATAITSAGPLNFSTRTGCVIEDLFIENALATSAAVIIGTSSQAQIGATLRRCKVANAVQGISVYRPDTLLEDVLIDGCDNDGLNINTTATQSLHSGRFFRGKNLSILNCGRDTVAGIGDAIQMTSTSTGWAGNLEIANLYIYKLSAVKQGVMFGLINGVVKVQGAYMDGGAAGRVSFGVTGTGANGAVTFRNCVFSVTDAGGNAIVRIASGALASGSTITLDSLLVLCSTYGGLFQWGGGIGTVAGKVYVRNCTAIGVAGNGLSYSAAVSGGTPETLDAAAELVCENNVFIGASPVAMRVPNGGLNDARWIFRNNYVSGATAVGAENLNTYSTVAAFQTAHSSATVNGSGDPLLTSDYKPTATSPLVSTGKHFGYRRDIEGKQRPNPPSIGAYDAATVVALVQ